MRGSRTQARRRRHFRVRKNVRGTEARPRLAVFRSNRYISTQLIDDVAGHTMATASSHEAGLRERTLTVETASEVGRLIAERAKSIGIDEVVFDRGGLKYHGRVEALADAAREEGLKF